MRAEPDLAGAGQTLRVLLNDRPLRSTLTGVGHYIQQLLQAMEDAASPVRVDPFLFGCILRRDWRGRGSSGASPKAAPSPKAPRSAGRAAKPFWLRRILDAGYGTAFRWIARRPGRYSLYHEPNHIPIRCDLPTVTTIHDLSVLVHPEWHPADRVRWYEREFGRGLRQSVRLIAASDFTRREIAERCGVAPDLIDVIYQAPRPAFFPRSPEQVREMRESLRLPERYYLFVGTLEPRKNVSGLLDAYAALPAAVRERHPLVLIGTWGWKEEAVRRKLAERNVAAHVRVLGYVSDEEMACAYSGCTALVWPTYYEGFGLPPLEAMACGAPVITSGVASLPEVVGTAGILLDPHAASQWTEALHQVAEDAASRRSLSESGRRQAARFSWRRCAEETIASYRAALRQR